MTNRNLPPEDENPMGWVDRIPVTAVWAGIWSLVVVAVILGAVTFAGAQAAVAMVTHS